MAKITEKQSVKLFHDESDVGIQQVYIDTSDNWINVMHSGEELSMSLNNWDELVKLVETAKSKINE